MSIERHLLQEWAALLRKRLARATVEALASLDAELSGDDSGLTSAWEEICVQVQDEYSLDWDIYEEFIRDLLRSALLELTNPEQVALSLSTDAGLEWLMEAGDNDVPPDFEDDVIDELMTELLSLAEDFESPNISRFIWGDDDENEDEDEGSEDDDEEDAASKP